eukprot:SAG22_NODE_4152_length_1366_cov_2.859511_2_plen_83_part_01
MWSCTHWRQAGYGWAATLAAAEKKQPKSLAVVEADADGRWMEATGEAADDGGGSRAAEWLRLLLPEYVATALLRPEPGLAADV